jgi:hypothetical protein
LGHTGATSGPRTTGPQRITTVIAGPSSAQLSGHTRAGVAGRRDPPGISDTDRLTRLSRCLRRLANKASARWAPASPSGRADDLRAGLRARCPRRPCPRRALSIGRQGSSTDNHGPLPPTCSISPSGAVRRCFPAPGTLREQSEGEVEHVTAAGVVRAMQQRPGLSGIRHGCPNRWSRERESPADDA